MKADDTQPFGLSPRLYAGVRVFDRFRLMSELGAGASGTVWLAHDERLDRDVALKFVAAEIGRSREALSDVLRETKTALRLTHPSIVRIFDFHEGVHGAAISMEYVSGQNLSELKAARPQRCIDAAELETIIDPLCSALAYAHGEARIVHRDIKPSNLMVTSMGELKITDFGISHSLSDTLSALTGRAFSSGTPAFMSPQQMMGEMPSSVDDIYSVGATLYDLLAGKPPFYRGNIMEQLASAIPASIEQRRRELEIVAAPVPANWETAIQSCLAKDPRQRPQSADDLRALLHRPAPRSSFFEAVAQVSEDTEPRPESRPAGPERVDAPHPAAPSASSAADAASGSSSSGSSSSGSASSGSASSGSAATIWSVVLAVLLVAGGIWVAYEYLIEPGLQGQSSGAEVDADADAEAGVDAAAGAGVDAAADADAGTDAEAGSDAAEPLEANPGDDPDEPRRASAGLEASEGLDPGDDPERAETTGAGVVVETGQLSEATDGSDEVVAGSGSTPPLEVTRLSAVPLPIDNTPAESEARQRPADAAVAESGSESAPVEPGDQSGVGESEGERVADGRTVESVLSEARAEIDRLNLLSAIRILESAPPGVAEDDRVQEALTDEIPAELALLARTRIETGSLEEAARFLERAVRLAPDHPEVLSSRALLFEARLPLAEGSGEEVSSAAVGIGVSVSSVSLPATIPSASVKIPIRFHYSLEGREPRMAVVELRRDGVRVVSWPRTLEPGGTECCQGQGDFALHSRVELSMGEYTVVFIDEETGTELQRSSFRVGR